MRKPGDEPGFLASWSACRQSVVGHKAIVVVLGFRCGEARGFLIALLRQKPCLGEPMNWAVSRPLPSVFHRSLRFEADATDRDVSIPSLKVRLPTVAVAGIGPCLSPFIFRDWFFGHRPEMVPAAAIVKAGQRSASY